MVAGAAALGLEIHHGFQLYLVVLLPPHQDKQGPRCSHATCSWTTSGTLPRKCCQQDLPRQYFPGDSGHMAEWLNQRY